MIPLKLVTASNINTLFNVTDEFDYPITKHLRDDIDWKLVFSLIESYKSTHNGRMMRFVKSEITARGIEEFSNGQLKYVDEIGYDFVMPQSGIRIELKSGLKMFQPRAWSTIDIKLSNTNGQSSHDKEFIKTFDYLLMVEPGTVGVVSWEKVQPYVRSVGDGFCAKIPLRYVEIFKEGSDVVDLDIDLSDRAEEMIKQCIRDIKELIK
jgi:hypothetical protein